MKSTNNSATKEITEIACPQCKKKVLWHEESKYRPFCSSRCQMIDFGDWAMEKNTIAADDPPDDWENFDD